MPDYINPYKRFIGSFIPNWLLERSEVSSGAKLAYARLAQYADKSTGVAWPKQETLAAELGVSERQAHSYIKELEKHALIERDRRGLGRSNEYRFLEHDWFSDRKNTAVLNTEPQNPAVQEPRNTAAASYSKEIHLKESSDKEKNKSLIESIYQAYPKKVSRKEGIRSITKAIATIKHPDPATWLLERTKAYAISVFGKDKQYIPNPSTWFNQERFNDEIETAQPESTTLKDRLNDKPWYEGLTPGVFHEN